MRSLPLVLAFLCFLFCALQVQGQPLLLDFHRKDDTSIALLKSQRFNKASDLVAQIQKSIPLLQDQGYLAASIDSVSITAERYDVYYYAGKPYTWAELRFDSLARKLLIAANINAADYTNKPVQSKALARLTERILQHCEDNGYPFAKVWLDQVAEPTPRKIKAVLRVDRAEMRKIDSLIISGNVDIAPSFVHRYLDIAKGSLYNEKKLRQISNKLRDLPFLGEERSWELLFKPGDTRLNLFLKEKRANQLNAILGLMPNNLQANRLLLSADVQFALHNFLGKGEFISASFQNLQVQSPRIKTDVVVPYLFRSPIGAELHFDFFSNNLQFRKVSLQTGIRYQLSGNDFIRVYYQALGNRILTVDTASILASRQLPANIDARSNGLGFEVQNFHVDSRINPRKGWVSKLSFTAMNRKILTNNSIIGLKDGTGFDFATLYDTITKSTYQYHLVASLEDYIPLSRIVTLKLAYNGAYIAAPKVFQNELFQIGGFRLLRGFDEQSIFASQYHVGTVELRLRYGQNSFAYAFSDNAWVETKFHNYARSGLFNGFGIGTSLETKNGLFSIALAYGRSDFLPLRFRESKLSFGYVALF